MLDRARNRADFAQLPDLAVRTLGGSVVSANDEFFADRENLIKPEPAVFNPHTFGHKGQIYDGWETRRRREPGHDWAIVRLGAPGVIRGIVVDTAFFAGNFPEQCSLEAASVAGYPSPEELISEQVEWVEIMPPTPLEGDTQNAFAISSEQRFTHVRLNIFPDGGVARLRVHGEVVPDPRWFAGRPLDLAALQNGGIVIDCSNMFYASPNNLLMPGTARVMGEGWETARRRGDGNDHVTVRLAGEGLVHQVEIDTTHFKGNSPGWFRLTGGTDPNHPEQWAQLIPRTRLQSDTRHEFLVSETAPVTHARVDIYPDGGFARLRIYGKLTPAGRERVGLQWYDRLPTARAAQVLEEEAGLAPDLARRIAAARPLLDTIGVNTALSATAVDSTAASAARTFLLG